MSKRELHNVVDMSNNFLARGDPNDYGPDIWDEVKYTNKRVWYVTNSILCSEGKPSKEEIADILDFLSDNND